MTANIPSPTDLLYFVEVARLSNLSRAAESLGISQPSLTLAIRRIEHSVGTDIIVRHKRGVTLTVAGKQLLIHTRQLLQQWEMVRSEALASENDIQGCFTIGCHPSVALSSLPLFLPQLINNNPKLEIKLQHDLSRRITEQVINLKIDVGIAVNPTRHPDLVIKLLANDKVTLWRGNSKEHKVLNLQSGDAVLLCDPELLQTQAILKAMKKRNMKYSRIISSNNLEVITELTKHGCGIGILPGSVAAQHHLTEIAKAPHYEDEICLLYRGENRHVKAIQTITKAISDAKGH